MNMAYCQFTNTLLAMKQCIETLQQQKTLADMSIEERDSCVELQTIAEEYMLEIDRIVHCMNCPLHELM